MAHLKVRKPLRLMGKLLRKCASLAVDATDRVIGYAPVLIPAEDALLRRDVLIRWGDGESSLAVGKSTSFQTASPALAKELRRLCRTPDPRINLCFPGVLLKNSPFTGSDDRFRQIWILSALIMRIWARGGPYADSLMFRRESGMLGFESLSAVISQAKRVLLVSSDPRDAECLRTFQGDGHFQQLLVPSRNAYCRRDEIKNSILALGKPDVLLLSAGPTGKCLAPELIDAWREGVKIIDTGHLFDQLRGPAK